ncbi:Response regulator PleD [compost metagenome]
MPGMDGWSVLSVLKADPVLSTIPIVMVTMVDDKRKAFALGADDFLVKPVSRDDMSRVLEQLLPEPTTVLAVEAAASSPLAQTLTQRGWHVAVAHDRPAALESLAAQRPAVVLLDMALPERQAFALLETLQDDTRFADLPVIAVTPPDWGADDGCRLADLALGRPATVAQDTAGWLNQMMQLLGVPGAR